MASRIMYLVYDCPKLFSLRNLSIYSNLISQQYDNKAKTFNYIEFGCASLKPLLTRKPIGEKCQMRQKKIRLIYLANLGPKKLKVIQLTKKLTLACKAHSKQWNWTSKFSNQRKLKATKLSKTLEIKSVDIH